jgi:DNA-binding NtrC family response regulator
VLETGRVRRVGGNGDVAVSPRVVALTLRDLPHEVERGRFRLDLFHRLAGFELALPTLRQRRGDIPALVTLMLEQIASEVGPRAIEPDALAALMAHDWPGNVRQLKNVLRRAALLCPQRIGVEALGLSRPTYAAEPAAEGARSYLSDGALGEVSASIFPPTAGAGPPSAITDDLLPLRDLTFDEIERSVYRWALQRNGGSRRRAARALGLARSTFCDKVKRHGLA